MVGGQHNRLSCAGWSGFSHVIRIRLVSFGWMSVQKNLSIGYRRPGQKNPDLWSISVCMQKSKEQGRMLIFFFQGVGRYLKVVFGHACMHVICMRSACTLQIAWSLKILFKVSCTLHSCNSRANWLALLQIRGSSLYTFANPVASLFFIIAHSVHFTLLHFRANHKHRYEQCRTCVLA
jgi:hypothetical protein